MNKEVKKELENIYNNDQEARIIWKRLEKEYGSNSKEVKKNETYCDQIGAPARLLARLRCVRDS